MINDLKDLKKFLKILREEGVTKATMGNLTVELGDLPIERVQFSDEQSKDQLQGFPQGELTPEQLIFYSSGGLPSDDPFLKDKQ